ncbi:DNA polymerase IV [Candidatus Shapirobacteria bacterium]|nr:DNA polymerase IV [Candidatus Shapirobacteria bacterium]
MINLDFNQCQSTFMHVDLNSCFARIEQQANPLLRGRPIAVAAYDSPRGCILAPSVEAKALGIKTGFRIFEAKKLCPNLIVLTSDPDKYRFVHHKLHKLLSYYTADYTAKSIDEFSLNFQNFPGLKIGLHLIGREIKSKIKSEIGDWLTVSVGIGPNRFLAKTASNLHKPDGLDEINSKNYLEIYQKLELTDLTGIARANATHLHHSGIFSVMDFYNAPIHILHHAFNSINGYYWYLRLRGLEIDNVDFARKSFGHMYSLPKPLSTPEELSPILHKLVVKAGLRLRSHGYTASGVHISLLYRDRQFWHHGAIYPEPVSDDYHLYRRAYKIMSSSPYHSPVANLAVTFFNLSQNNSLQLDLFGDIKKHINLNLAIDKVTQKYGSFVLTPAKMLGLGEAVHDAIGFGNIS